MSRKLEISITLAGLVVALVALVPSFGAWLVPISTAQPTSSGAQPTSTNAVVSRLAAPIAPTDRITTPRASLMNHLAPTATLVVSGTGANVKIRRGPADARYAGGEITSTGAESVIYLPLGQPQRPSRTR